MFGIGRKKKEYLLEFSNVLSDLGNVPTSEVRKFTDDYRTWILSETLDRDLNAFTGVWNICDKSMERIHLAHYLKEYSGAKVVPDYMLLAALKTYLIIKKAVEDSGDQAPSSNLLLVLDLPVDIGNPEFTYKDLLTKLSAADGSGIQGNAGLAI